MRKADNLPLSCAVVTKSGNLNFLEPSWPVQACNGTALPLSNILPEDNPLRSEICWGDYSRWPATSSYAEVLYCGPYTQSPTFASISFLKTCTKVEQKTYYGGSVPMA